MYILKGRRELKENVYMYEDESCLCHDLMCARDDYDGKKSCLFFSTWSVHHTHTHIGSKCVSRWKHESDREAEYTYSM